MDGWHFPDARLLRSVSPKVLFSETAWFRKLAKGENGPWRRSEGTSIFNFLQAGEFSVPLPETNDISTYPSPEHPKSSFIGLDLFWTFSSAAGGNEFLRHL